MQRGAVLILANIAEGFENKKILRTLVSPVIRSQRVVDAVLPTQISPVVFCFVKSVISWLGISKKSKILESVSVVLLAKFSDEINNIFFLGNFLNQYSNCFA